MDFPSFFLSFRDGLRCELSFFPSSLCSVSNLDFPALLPSHNGIKILTLFPSFLLCLVSLFETSFFLFLSFKGFKIRNILPSLLRNQYLKIPSFIPFLPHFSLSPSPSLFLLSFFPSFLPLLSFPPPALHPIRASCQRELGVCLPLSEAQVRNISTTKQLPIYFTVKLDLAAEFLDVVAWSLRRVR